MNWLQNFLINKSKWLKDKHKCSSVSLSYFPIVHLLVMYIEVYRNESFDVIASSTLISIFNDDLFFVFDHNRWDGKVEQRNDYTFACYYFVSLRSLSTSENEWMKIHFLVKWQLKKTQMNSICSTPDVSRMTWKLFHWNEQIKTMLRLFDRIASKIEHFSIRYIFLFSRLSVPPSILNMCSKIQIYIFLQFHFSLSLLHHINNNLSLFFQPIVNLNTYLTSGFASHQKKMIDSVDFLSVRSLHFTEIIFLIMHVHIYR